MTASDVIAFKAIFRQELRGYRPFWEGVTRAFKNPDVGEPLIKKSSTTDELLASLRNNVDAAENYYVSADMMKLATAASEVMPDDAEIKPQSIPTPQGFMVFATPFRMWDIRGSVVVVNAVMWSVYGGHVSLTMLTDKYDPLERQAFSLRAYAYDGSRPVSIDEFPRLSPLHLGRVEFNNPLPQSITLQGAKPIPPEVTVTVRQDEDGNVFWAADDDGFTAEDMKPVRKTDTFSKFITTVWRLMKQTLVATREEEAVDKRSRRLAHKHLADKRHVTIIALRRVEYHGKGDRQWVLDHRVLVRGYTRKQWYGSGEDQWFDYIYIQPYIKGPEGTPLVITDKINALVR